MTKEKNDVLKISLLNQLEVQRENFIKSRDFTQTNLNQLVGAIHACDVMIQMHKDEAIKELPKAPKGEKKNVKVDDEQKEQVA
jgi:hypothetical protein